MKQLWKSIGRIVYWLAWPALFIYLYPSHRTRVVVEHNNKILIVRGWFGSGSWSLPGGGMHRSETPKQGAVRELKEEVGIEVNATQLQELYTNRVTNHHKHRFTVHAFGLRLKSSPNIKKQRGEISEALWRSKQEILDDSMVSSNTKAAVRAFYQQ